MPIHIWCGMSVSWAIGLPRRAGARVHATNDAESRWWHWSVTERCGGLVRQYRDTRFEALPRSTTMLPQSTAIKSPNEMG